MVAAISGFYVYLCILRTEVVNLSIKLTTLKIRLVTLNMELAIHMFSQVYMHISSSIRVLIESRTVDSQEPQNSMTRD